MQELPEANEMSLGGCLVLQAAEGQLVLFPCFGGKVRSSGEMTALLPWYRQGEHHWNHVWLLHGQLGRANPRHPPNGHPSALNFRWFI